MIIVMKAGASQQQIEHVFDKVKELGFIKETVEVPKYADLSLVEEAAKRRR